ncbi:hypothetical protein J7T55_006797 [Diaporthe amygdali]|uniref:uncharacterized protein n=1 Tax=Phomopsis amygdali TaxID=1214568 RepID=UPI0022FEE7C7|nr:uncharacterized protein J7T55_006797 [Diaporthe amygdali]KAJ0125451.1 hypothetical protein J7T55_006797 [Diaporthe amygdali]
MSDAPTSRKFARTCDTCKSRKVRCSVNVEVTVNNSQSPGEHSPRITESAGGQPADNLPNLYVDKLLAQARTTGSLKDSKPFAVESSLAYHDMTRPYFTRAHPLYPFLDRKAFEDTMLAPTFLQEPQHNKAWLALYNAVLALGCQLCEAARRAQNLRSHKLPESSTFIYQKAFWTLYSVEKISSFHFGRPSAFADHDISVPIPVVPEAIFGDYDWMLANARYGRLLSRAASSLFCAGVTGKTEEYFLEVIDQLERELEQWRMTTPVNGKPNDTFRINLIETSLLRTASVWTHLMYNSFRLALCRARLYLAARTRGLVSTVSQAESTSIMSEAARNVLELAAFIDVDPSTPFWFAAGIPMASLLVVFDVVISYPKHAETNTNLALLDVGGGHFSRIEYASAGWLPGSLLTQLSQIAREYVSRGKTNDGSSVPPGKPHIERVTSTSSEKVPQPALNSELGATSGPPLQPAFDTVPDDSDLNTENQISVMDETDKLFDPTFNIYNARSSLQVSKNSENENLLQGTDAQVRVSELQLAHLLIGLQQVA